RRARGPTPSCSRPCSGPTVSGCAGCGSGARSPPRWPAASTTTLTPRRPAWSANARTDSLDHVRGRGARPASDAGGPRGGPSRMAVDVDVLEQIRERLRVSTRVGDERIEGATRDDDVVLLGAVATPEEATVAGQLAEEYATSVVNELQVDRGLREGVEEPLDTEPASPAGDEVLVGSTDMLAGPETVPTEDLAEALDENEPWTPPDVPQLAPTATEQRGGVPPSDALALSEWEEEGGDPDDLLDEEDREAREGRSAPHPAPAHLARPGQRVEVPSLDPTAATPGGDPEAEAARAASGGG